MSVLHNEIEGFAAGWLENLAAAGVVPAHHVDRRSIADLRGRDLAGFEQVHFFAGIGGWSEALRLAGWPAGRPVWTGSCPCQPYSNAGKHAGDDDPRNLWPEFRRLIRECGPPIVFGEQVASKAGREWLAGVRADLEAMGYAVGSADLCAPGVGAPHIRQRLFWGAARLADADGWQRGWLADSEGCVSNWTPPGRQQGNRFSQSGSVTSGLADMPSQRWDGSEATGGEIRGRRLEDHRTASRLPNATSERRGEAGAGEWRPAEWSPWLDAYGYPTWLLCLDGKWRRIPAEPEFFPLAHGVPGRLGRLRAYGNAIIPQVAALFIQEFMAAAEGMA